MSDIQLKLGERIFCNISEERTGDWDMIYNRNQVYTPALSENGVDQAQFEYDPDKKWIKFGKVIQRATSATDQGEESLYNVYFKPYIVGVDGAIIEQGQSGGQFDQDINSGGSSSGIITIGAGEGVTINYDNPQTPIISIDGSSFASKDEVNVLRVTLSNHISNCGGSTSVNLDTPDYAALLELLNVLEVQYEDEPIGECFNTVEDIETGEIFYSSGIRFKWVNDDFTTNCIRYKNLNTSGTRKNTDVFLKIVECKRLEGLNDRYEYAEIGSPIITVSSNSVNFQNENEQEQWYEWYFPKYFTLKQNTVYAIIPHHDKSYVTVTDSEAKIIIFGSSDIHSANKTINGIWIDERNESFTQSEQKTPIIQFCNKIPTTIIMKQ